MQPRDMQRPNANDSNIFMAAMVALSLAGVISWVTMPPELQWGMWGATAPAPYGASPATWERYCGEQMMWPKEDLTGCFTPTKAQIRAQERQLACEAGGDQWVDGDCVAVTD